MKSGGRKGKDKKKKSGTADLSAAFAALEMEPEEEQAEVSDAAPLQEDTNGISEASQPVGKNSRVASL